MNAFKHGLAAIQKRREDGSRPSTRRGQTTDSILLKNPSILFAIAGSKRYG